MDIDARYQSKLTTPDEAVSSIPSGSKLSFGMAMTEPPALLKALADRAEAGGIENLNVYYFEATSIAGRTILRYELNDRIRPYCMFITETERALIKRGSSYRQQRIPTVEVVRVDVESCDGYSEQREQPSRYTEDGKEQAATPHVPSTSEDD